MVKIALLDEILLEKYLKKEKIFDGRANIAALTLWLLALFTKGLVTKSQR